MKIMMLNTLYAPHVVGGAEIIFQEQAEGFAKLGYEVTVVTTSGGNQVSWETKNGVSVCRIPIVNVYWHYEKDKASAFKHKLWHILDIYNVGMKRALLKVVNQVNPDVAVCHNLSGFSISAWDVFKSKNIPVVQVLHDQYLLCPNSNAFKNGKICEKQCAVCHLMRLPHRKASSQVDAVVGVSKFVLDRMVSRGYFEDSQKFVIHNARQFPDIPMPKPWDGKSPLRIGYIGTLSRVKGVEWLIKSFMALPDINATLSIAGKGETPEYEEYLRQLASADKRISFTGYTKPENHYPNIHLSVVPSLWPDTFPTVAFESCAYHVPVIATKVGGLPEIIKEGENGMLVDACDEASLKVALGRIYTDADALEKLMMKARESVGEFMDKKRVLREYCNIMENILNIKMSCK